MHDVISNVNFSDFIFCSLVIESRQEALVVLDSGCCILCLASVLSVASHPFLLSVWAGQALELGKVPCLFGVSRPSVLCSLWVSQD